MKIVEANVFDAVRRGYGELSLASNEEIVSYFEAIEPEAIQGHTSHVKGILFEQEYVRQLEGEGIEAATFETINHPVIDIEIADGFGAVSEVQLKATEDAYYVSSAMEQYPEVSFAVTSEVAADLEGYGVIDTGIENAALEEAVTDTLVGEAVNPIGGFALLRLLFGLPF